MGEALNASVFYYFSVNFLFCILNFPQNAGASPPPASLYNSMTGGGKFSNGYEYFNKILIGNGT